jgi:hypothetical protein
MSRRGLGAERTANRGPSIEREVVRILTRLSTAGLCLTREFVGNSGGQVEEICPFWVLGWCAFRKTEDGLTRSREVAKRRELNRRRQRREGGSSGVLERGCGGIGTRRASARGVAMYGPLTSTPTGPDWVAVHLFQTECTAAAPAWAGSSNAESRGVGGQAARVMHTSCAANPGPSARVIPLSEGPPNGLGLRGL